MSPLHAICRHNGMLAAVLVLATLVAYIPALRSGFVWDDDDHVTRNIHVQTREGLQKIWFHIGATAQYYPMVYTSFWIEHRLWHLNPFGYHLVNVLLHIINALLLWRVLERLKVPGAFLAAAVFALHPVHVESVAWISERKNVLSGFFYLSSLLSSVRFFGVDQGHESEDDPKPSLPAAWHVYLMSFGLFAAALLSKTVTCTLPVVLGLLIWWKRSRIGRREMLLLIPMVAAGLMAGLNTVWLERHHVGAEGGEWNFSFVERCLIAGRALWFYAGKLIWPSDLAFIYPRWVVDSGKYGAYLFPLAAGCVVGAVWAMRKRRGRGLPVAILCFIITLSPALGFFNVYPMRFSFVADHFQYLASIGLIALFAAFFNIVEWTVPVRRVAGGLLMVVLGVLTWNQCRIYTNLETLWRDTIAKNPDSWMPNDNLGILMGERGEIGEAAVLFARVIQLKPNHANAYSNLGICLDRLGRRQEAMDRYREALRLNPEHVEANFNLAIALEQGGRVEAAVSHYHAAIRNKPDHVPARVNLGVLLAKAGREEEAASHFTYVLRIHPGHPAAAANLERVASMRESNVAGGSP